MFRHKRKIITLLICAGIFAAASFAFAQGDLGLNEFGAQTQLSTKSIGQIVAEIIRIFLGILGIIAVVLVLYGGFVWMTAAGDPIKITTAKKILINGVIGLAIILSAFAITHFIVGALERATGTRLEGPPGVGPGPGGLPAGAFIVKGISPQGKIQIRNVVVRMSFNHNVEKTTVNGNILITKKNDSSIVGGDFNVTGDKIEFTPSAACPAPNQTIKCFDSDTDYKVEIKTGLKDTGGKNLYCGALAATKCKAEFTTGSLIDTQPPQVAITYPDPGQSVSENSMVDVWAKATDDAGISHVEFFADGAYFDSAYPAGASPTEFEGKTFWDTANATRGNHSLSGKAYDIDSNNAFSPSINVVVRAEHCFNNLKDFDETGVDCGGNDCAKCSGESCTENFECASGSCVGGICVDTPIILNVSPTDGAPGTYVSILGKYFGAPPAGGNGTVTFLGGAGTADDKIALSLSCSTATWTDTYVIVAVPQGAKSGPIEIKTPIGTDATNDARGPALPDFLINSIQRPGICALNPNQGKSGNSFQIEGDNFGSTQNNSYIKFGNVFAMPQGWANKSITALVPVLQAGVNSVIVNKGGVDSNTLPFKLLSPTAGTKPTINYVDPEKGPAGEYITIFGGNFGDKAGIVEFLKADGSKAIGDTKFPAVCGAVDYWNNSSITVKIPAKFADGSSTKNVNTSLLVKRVDGTQSNSVSFNINSDTPKPGICGLKPNNGPINTAVEVLGERFGANGTVTFYNQKSAVVTAWGKEVVKTSVPTGAVSGPFKVTVAGKDSNSANFTVGDCSQNPTFCTLDEQCCKSSCISKTEECKTGPKEGAYGWRISTGFIPKAPKVIEECLAGNNVDSPSPAPWDSRPGGKSVCVNAAINVRFDSNLDKNTIDFNGTANDTVVLYKCTEAAQDKDPCTQVAKIAIDSNSPGIYNVSNEEQGVLLYPQNKLEKNTQYLLELTTGIEGEKPGGGPMEERAECGSGIGYCFRFKTKNSDTLCEVGSVLVAPRVYTSNKMEYLNYLATPRDKADICLILDPRDYSYEWTSSQSGNASIIGGKKFNLETKTIESAEQNEAVAETKFETPKDTPAIIKSEITTEKVSGKGELTIKFTDPIVVSKWPDCTTACVNATIGAKFNTDMDANTLRPANIEVKKCKTENCNTFETTNVAPKEINYYKDDQKKDYWFEFIPSTNLETSRYYLVRLHRFDIKSTSNVSLTGSDTAFIEWQFKTRIDSTPCIVNKINVNPTSKVLNYIGQIAQFDSEPIGAPDNCNPQGQKLNPYSFNWGWLSANIKVPTNPPSGYVVASMVNNGAYNVLPLENKNCSSMCLRIGSKPGVSVCGNSKKEKGEDCDDGNNKNGDRCSSTCLNEGGGSNCGNNKKDAGEECDGEQWCSSNCLRKGSSSAGSICGNNDIGDGEDCDDGNSASGDGCSRECLNEGTQFGIASCGNGIVENDLGEDCDDGGIANGDGCSSNCLNEGSIVGGGTCGKNGVEKTKGEDCDDGNNISGDGCSMMCLNEGSSLNYKSSSICGNKIVETGEDCDFGRDGNDTYIDPRQYAEAKGKGTAKISATADKVIGSSSVEVKCDYPTDNACKQFGANLGAGSDYCCYQKAEIIERIPPINKTNVCRNTLISFKFNQKMDSSAGIVHIDELKNGAWFNDAVKATRSSLDIYDEATKTTKTRFDFAISTLLKSNIKYKIRVEQFKSPKGVTAQYNEWTFTTGKEICKFEKIEFIPDPVVFNSVNDKTGKLIVKQITAVAQTQSGDSISSIPGIYDWKWAWAPDTDIKDSIILASATANPAQVNATSENGDGQLAAIAKIQNIPKELEKDAEKTIIDSVNVIVFLCEYPWQSTPEKFSSAVIPYKQDKYNFKTYYCRDGSELLPYLNIADKIIPSSPKILKEMLFTDPASGDAVGLRIYGNMEHLSPLDWYKKEKFVGSPQSSKVDGYEAVVDGRSIYINAANYTGNNYTNIFVISYNQGAGNEIKNIYSQLLKNWKFNTNLEKKNIKLCKNDNTKSCESDLDCKAGDSCQNQKDKLRRDTKRLQDLNKIGELLENYKQANNTYPQLLSGTFLRGWSVSTWPSWQATLGNELGTAMPTDPLNQHYACNISSDVKTCWDGEIGKYQCIKGSHLYRYKNISQDNYELAVDFEFWNNWAWKNPPKPNFKIVGTCNDAEYGTLAVCGDGVVGIGEDCEKGQESSRVCTGGYMKQVCNLTTCQWKDSGSCQVGQCGDGVKQVGEICDDGQNNGKYGFCNTSCTGLVARCGDGKTNGPEQCDLGYKNGKYNSGCSWDCKLPGLKCGDNIVQNDPTHPTKEECDGNSETTQKAIDGSACPISGGYPTYNTRTCESDCTWSQWSGCKRAGSCGNAIKEGTEQCDDGTASNTDSCVTGCKSAVCGDGYIWSGKEICDNGKQNGDECDPAYGLTCNYCGLSCNVVTKTGDYCGDEKKNDPEECDSTDFGTSNCNSYGYFEFYSGSLKSKTGLTCKPLCTVDTLDCLKVFRINAGGPTFTDFQNREWVYDKSPDKFYSYVIGGTWPGEEKEITNASLERIYRSERYAESDLNYSFYIGNGTYMVKLHFAEIFLKGGSKDKRIFDIKIEGITVLSNFNIAQAAGYNKAIVKSFSATVKNKILNIDLHRVSGNHGPKISAIEIEKF